MKTLKTAAISTLVTILTFGPVGYAAAADYKIKGWDKKKSVIGSSPVKDNIIGKLPPGSFKCPNCSKPNPPAQVPTEYHHHDHDRGAVWAALAGGTVLGVVMSSMANQPDQSSEPTVVVVQDTTGDDQGDRQQTLAEEIERERAKALALEEELQRLRANRD